MKNRFLKLIEEAQIAGNATYRTKEKEKDGKEVEKTIKRDLQVFRVGDTVDVHVRILEGAKERIQVYSGVVVGRRGEGMGEMFTVRRIVQGEGVERVFPLQSPKVAKIEVKRTGRVRRAKLYYLRKRVGKATRLRERRVKVADGAEGKKKTKAPAPAES
jgi:large subunit ribosomal protein L19